MTRKRKALSDDHGMPCPSCGKAGRSVLESRYRERNQEIARRCSCINCGFRYTTRERITPLVDSTQSGRLFAIKVLEKAINQLLDEEPMP